VIHLQAFLIQAPTSFKTGPSQDVAIWFCFIGASGAATASNEDTVGEGRGIREGKDGEYKSSFDIGYHPGRFLRHEWAHTRRRNSFGTRINYKGARK
jgi:hypothetical protein